MASPECQVKEGVGAFGSAVGGVDVAPGASLSIRLADNVGVSQWELEIFGTDELTVAPPAMTDVNILTHIVTSPSTVVTLTFPNATGRALGFRSTIIASGVPSESRFAIFTTVGGKRVGFVGEVREGNTDFGWATKVNPLIRASGTALPALPGEQYAVLMEDPIGTPVWQRITEDMVLPAFAVAMSGGGLKEIGESVVTPAFTASYTSGPATLATLTDTEATPAEDVTASQTAFASDGTFMKNVYGQSVTFTLTAQKGTITKVSTQTLTWVQKVFWGVSSSAGPYNEAFIEGLTDSALATSRARTFTVTAGATDRIYYAFRTAYGTPTFTVGGFEGGFELIASAVSVTNAQGIVETYDVWRSVQPNLGNTTVTVS